MTSRWVNPHTIAKDLSSFGLMLCLLLWSWLPSGMASEAPEIPALKEIAAPAVPEAWLVTYGPGNIYWERFGHNAIWLREPVAGIDHTFNFGFFDFEQQDFMLRFAQGRMLYFAVAQPAAREFEFYRNANRSIRLQKLNLNPDQYQRLRNYLLEEIKPENRDYRYDYYLNNCSTRVRDALDIALEGALSERSKKLPADFNFRDQTRRLTQMQFWYYLGLELALGFPADHSISRWEEMFIPMVVAAEIATMPSLENAQNQALVASDEMLFTTTAPAAPTQPGSTWCRYFVLGLLVSVLAWLSGRFLPLPWLAGLCHAWLLVNATSGFILAALWWLTDHQVAGNNANLLLLNPLLILALLPSLKRFSTLLLTTGVGLNLILLLLPGHQYNLDALALLAPVNLSVAVYFWLYHTKFTTASPRLFH